MSAKKVIFLWALSLVLISCAPVLDRNLMDEGTREFNPSHLVETPDAFKDHLFIFGGVIVDTKLTTQGSQIEGLFIPVDGRGYLIESSKYQGRFIAVYPRSKGLLDPMIYKRGRQVSLAADFVEVRHAKIDEMEYTYPVFDIRQIYLWDQYADYPYSYYGSGYYSYPYYYPYYYPYPYYYGPWYRPYPFWGPPMW